MLLIIDNKQQYGLPVFNTTVYPHLVRRLKIVPHPPRDGVSNISCWKVGKNAGLMFLGWVGHFPNFYLKTEVSSNQHCSETVSTI